MNKSTIATIILLSCGIYAGDMMQNKKNMMSMMDQKDNANAKKNGAPQEDSNRIQMAQKLNALLADEFALYTKTLKYHWNIVGPFFGPLHSLFGTQYEQLAINLDHIAERIRSLDQLAHGTLQEFKDKSSIKETPGQNPDAMAMVRDLLTGHEIIIRHIKEYLDFTTEINDMGTNNMLAGLVEQHEKTAWMLRAHLQ